MTPSTRLLLAAFTALALGAPGSARAQSPAGASDFDFNQGVWTTRIHRTLHPLSGSAEAMDLHGTVTVRPLWHGASLEEIEADGPKGHWEGLTLFLYNPGTRQWSQSFANSAQGVLGTPSVGEFKDGHGELVSADTLDGRAILVRAQWTPGSTPATHRYDEAYSDDVGKSWHPAFGAELTRVAAVAPPLETRPDVIAKHPGSHDFDFELGKWKLHTRKLVHPLTGSKEWTDRTGTVEVRPVWGGKGNLVHLEADGPEGHVEMSALRLYNPGARQWSIHFATPKNGDLGPPLIGEFHGGRGAFYDQEEIGGRTRWVRLTIFPVSPDEVQTEQAFSDDQGATWEVNQVTHSTRIRE